MPVGGPKLDPKVIAMRTDPSELELTDPRRGDRLQRVMADAGIGARRACERMIEEGKVTINGRRVDRLPVFVDPRRDRIVVGGRVLPPPQHSVCVMLHKPTRTLTSRAEARERGDDDRTTVLDLVQHPGRVRLFPIGGLDYDTTGLILLTNDGELAERLTHKRHGTRRVYHASVRGPVPEAALAALRRGVFVLDERRAESGAADGAGGAGGGWKSGARGPARDKPARARLLKLDARVLDPDRGRGSLEIDTASARDWEIMKALELVGHPVRKLTCVAVSGLRLSGLAEGQWRELEPAEIRRLRGGRRSSPVGGRPGGTRARDRGPARGARGATAGTASGLASKPAHGGPGPQVGPLGAGETSAPRGNALIRRRRREETR